MALIYSGQHQSSGAMMYEMYAEEISGSGNNRTIKITLKIKPGPYDTTNFAYPLNWRAYINGSWSSEMYCKGTEKWTGAGGWRTFTYTVTTNVGTTSSKAISVGFQTITGGGSTWWNLSLTNKTLTVGSTNVAPTWPSGAVLATTPEAGIVSEKLSEVNILWPSAVDTNLSAYQLAVSINGASYVTIYNGSSTSYKHNISSYGEGTTFRYAVLATDTYGASSAWLYSSATNITKNTFTMDTLASSGAITFASTLLALTYSGGSNSQGGVTISRVLSCDNGITVYNPTVSASPISLKIWRTGETVPTTSYIKFDDIKKLVATSVLKGKTSLTFTLTGTNSNSTSKTSSKTITVDLQTVPNNVTGAQISLVQTESTNYLSIASSSNKYFIPDGTKVTRVKWNAVVGKLGEACTYELYVAYGTGGYSKLADLATGTLYYNHVVPKQTISQQFKYLVRAKSTYNTSLYTEAATSAQTLHFYNPPALSQGTITRGSTTADVIVTVKSNSSIPNINTVGTWQVVASGTTTPVISSGSLSVSQVSQKIKVTGLTDAGTFELKVTYNDNTGYMTTPKLIIIGISANLPIFFINKYGVGVGGVYANSSNALKVKGNANIAGTLNATNLQVGGANVYHTNRKPSAADVGAVPTSRTVNGKALSANITLTSADVGAVPTTRRVNNKVLSADISLTASDVGAVSKKAPTYYTPTFTNGWVNYGGKFSFRYWKGDDGIVHLEGLIKNGLNAKPAFTLPNGFRPRQASQSLVAQGTGTCNIVVDLDGIVTPTYGVDSTWISLDNIIFYAD